MKPFNYVKMIGLVLIVSCSDILEQEDLSQSQVDLIAPRAEVYEDTNYPEQIPGYTWLIGTNAANDKVEIYNPGASDWNNSNALKWDFKPETAHGFSSAHVALWDFPRNVRFRNNAEHGGECVAAVGKELALVVSYPDKDRQWSADIGDVAPQSIEVLPNGNVAVSAASADWVRVYAASQGSNNTTYAQFNLISARAILWDPTNTCLWAVGKIPGGSNDFVLTALSVGGSSANPTLSEITSRRVTVLDGGPARDISPVIGDPNRFWISGNTGLYTYDKTSETFTSVSGPVNQSQYGSAGNQPHGAIVTLRSDGLCVNSCWSSSTIEFYTTTGLQSTKTRTSARFMSMHPCNPNYEYQPEYRIATYNIRSSNKNEATPEREWANRKENVKDMVKRYQMDIFGVQEAWDEQITTLETMGPYNNIGVSINGNTNGPSNNIFYRKWRFGLLDWGSFWLCPDGPTTPTGPCWDADQKRMVTWAKLEDLYTGFQFFVFNTHFQAPGPVSRLNSANLILNKLPEIAANTPAIVMGDLNADQAQYGFTVLRDSQLLEDSFDEAITNYSTRATGNGWDPYVSGDRRIDHVLATEGDWIFTSRNVLTDTYSGDLPSDHFPVLVEIKPN